MGRESAIPSWLHVQDLVQALNERQPAPTVQVPTDGKLFVKQQLTRKASIPEYVPVSLVDKAFVNRGRAALTKLCTKAGMVVQNVRAQNIFRPQKTGSRLPSPYIAQVDYIIEYQDPNGLRVTATAAVAFDERGRLVLPTSFFSRGVEVAFTKEAVKAHAAGRVFSPALVEPRVPRYHYYRPGIDRQLTMLGARGPATDDPWQAIRPVVDETRPTLRLYDFDVWRRIHRYVKQAIAELVAEDINPTPDEIAGLVAVHIAKDRGGVPITGSEFTQIYNYIVGGGRSDNDLTLAKRMAAMNAHLRKKAILAQSRNEAYEEGKSKVAARCDKGVPIVDTKEHADDVTSPKERSVAKQTMSDPDYSDVEAGEETAGRANFFTRPDTHLQHRDTKRAAVATILDFELGRTAAKDFPWPHEIDFRWIQEDQDFALSSDTKEYKLLNELREAEWEAYLDAHAHFGVTIEYDLVNDEFHVYGMQAKVPWAEDDGLETEASIREAKKTTMYDSKGNRAVVDDQGRVLFHVKGKPSAEPHVQWYPSRDIAIHELRAGGFKLKTDEVE